MVFFEVFKDPQQLPRLKRQRSSPNSAVLESSPSKQNRETVSGSLPLEGLQRPLGDSIQDLRQTKTITNPTMNIVGQAGSARGGQLSCI